MSGYDTLRAMRKGSDPDPDFEAWKNTLVEPDPYPTYEGEVQTNIDATVGDAGYDVKDENGVWRDDLPPFKLLRDLRAEGNPAVYNDALERCSTYAYTPEEDPPERIGTPYPERETTQTAIDAHAAGGDNVWQRGQTARQQAAMARDAQQARDLARPYRMAPKVAYKQAQEEQNVEPTQKSAMPELPSISSMIKGKREDPRENLFGFKKRNPQIDDAREASASHPSQFIAANNDLGANPIAQRENEGPYPQAQPPVIYHEQGPEPGKSYLLDELNDEDKMGAISPNVNGMYSTQGKMNRDLDVIEANRVPPKSPGVQVEYSKNIPDPFSISSPNESFKRLYEMYKKNPKMFEDFLKMQEEQNVEPTQKSAMPELPSISSMIKGKREDPRENLAEFKKRDTRLDQDRLYAAHYNRDRVDDQAWTNAALDLHNNDGDRTGVIGDRDRDMYPGSRVGHTPVLGDISRKRDEYIDDMGDRDGALGSMWGELYGKCDDITDYANQHGLDPDDLRSFMITLRDHYRDNRDSAKQTKDNLSSVVGDETQDEES